MASGPTEPDTEVLLTRGLSSSTRARSAVCSFFFFFKLLRTVFISAKIT